MSKVNSDELDKILSSISPGVDAEDKPVYLEANDYKKAKSELQALINKRVREARIKEVEWAINPVDNGGQADINALKERLNQLKEEQL